MLYGFTIEDACFVIEYQEEAKEITILSINLFANNTAKYSSISSEIHLFEGNYKLKNADPADHENIHIKMGELMGVDPEKTKTFSTHFHWVCKSALNVDLFCGLFFNIKDTIGIKVVKSIVAAAQNNFK
jgi:hypothetical protein